jgi:hypothetical protein
MAVTLPSVYQDGTATITGGTVVTGQSTLWVNAVLPGDFFGVHKGYAIRILSVDSDTQLTLANAWPGSAQTAAHYEIMLQSDVGRMQETSRQLLQQLSNGNIEALTGLIGAANSIPIFTGVGTMSLVEVGTSGNKIPLLDTANTWSAKQTTNGGWRLDAPSGSDRVIDWTTSGSQRWAAHANAAPESGSNAGSDFQISRFADNGTHIDNPLQINRATGVTTITNLAASSIADGSITVPKLAAEVATRLIEFDIRDSRFAGGAKFDDATDDTPAFAAAIAYFQTLGGINQYQGKNAARLRMPRGVSRVSNLDVTNASNVQFVGEGDGVTTLRNTANAPCINSTNVTGTNDSFRMAFRDFCIYGPGRANTSAHGMDLKALNNGSIQDVRFYACRDALRLTNNWQTDVSRLKVDGGGTVGGSLTCYNGVVMLDGPGAVLENAVKFYGGVISGCENWGFRGQSVTGSAIFGMEILACGQVGLYVGDNPSGKDLKWFTYAGGLIDTCGQLFIAHRGGATYGGQIHLSGLWMGYGNKGGGLGTAIEVQGINDATFRPDVIFNSDASFIASACDNVIFDFGTIQGYDRSLVGVVPIQLANSTNVTVRGGGMKKTPSSPSTICVAETGTSNSNNIQGINADGGGTIIGSTTIIKGNRGIWSRRSGQANIAAGAASVVVNHGCVRAPVIGDIYVTPSFNLAGQGVATYWVDTITSTSFTLNLSSATPNALNFHWSCDVSRG